MPTQQTNLFGGDPLPVQREPQERILCAGGCDRERPFSEMVETPVGLMCQRCADEVVSVCDGCDSHIQLNRWGESADLRHGPDGRTRCRECHESIYSRCAVCHRETRRDRGTVRHNPHNGDEVCDRCWRDCWFECTVCNEVYDRANSYHYDDHLYCRDCFDESYVQCGQCGSTMRRGDHSGWDGDPFCAECYGNAELWKTQPWSGEPGSFDKVGSTRRFGVEVETCDCYDYRTLHGKTEWGCVYECSTPGREFVSPILHGDNGFQEIRDFCDFARQHNWTVNDSCGLHIHVDISDDSPEECLRIAYAYRKTYSLWKKFVPSRRSDNSMCGSPQYSCEDIRTYEHIEDFAENRDRFEFVNWRAYIRHGSFEVRLYQGSLNAREMCNWISLHARFMDAVKGMTYDELDEKLGGNIRTSWPALCDLIGDANLLDYWRRKADNAGTELRKCWDADEVTEEPEPVDEPGEPGEPGEPVEPDELEADSSHPGWSDNGECNCPDCCRLRALNREDSVSRAARFMEAYGGAAQRISRRATPAPEAVELRDVPQPVTVDHSPWYTPQEGRPSPVPMDLRWAVEDDEFDD